jgi:hypothetical protein
MNRILITHEKHGKRYFDISTFELFAEKSFNLLKERFEQNYYTPYKPEKLDNPFASWVEEVMRGVSGEVSDIYLRLKREYDYTKASFKEEQTFYDSVKFIIDNEEEKYRIVGVGRYPVSYQYLDARSDAEYERISIEEVE